MKAVEKQLESAQRHLEESASTTSERYKPSYLTSRVSEYFVLTGDLPKYTVRNFHNIQQDRHRINYRAKAVSEDTARLHLSNAQAILRDISQLL